MNDNGFDKLSQLKANKLRNQLEQPSVSLKIEMVESVVGGVVILECVAFFVLVENAGHASHGKRIMVAVGGQVATVERLEIMPFRVDGFHFGKAFHALLADFAILHGIVVANHVEIEKIFDVAQRNNRVVDIIGRAAQIGIFA